MIYILGTERSASTWVANILDHHPQLDVYMEPLSDFNSQFKDWPSRFSKLQNLEERAQEFQKEFEILKNHRRFLLTRLNDSPLSWRTDLKLAELIVRKKLAAGFIKNFLETNFHRKDRAIPISKNYKVEKVIKELRLNFNADLLPLLNNRPKVIVSIRDMASCVRSIMKRIDQGYLIELKSELEEFYGKIEPKTLTLYWLRSYDALIRTLQNCKIPYKIAYHTELLSNPQKTTKKIFHFLDLPETPTVEKYLNMSNKAGNAVHSTKRNRKDLLKKIEEDRNFIYPKIEEELKIIQEHPFLKKYVRVK